VSVEVFVDVNVDSAISEMVDESIVNPVWFSSYRSEQPYCGVRFDRF